jgi:pimeloyl-ACP methyl ester carboxylesterase
LAEKIPLLLVPGLLCNAALWAHQSRYLDDIAAITIVDTTMDADFPAMVARALDTAPRHFALAGLSMGGYIAFEFMRQAADRVVKLALLDTSARAETPERAALRKPLLALAEQGRFNGVSPRLLPSFLHPDRLDDAALTQAAMDMAAGTGKDAFIRQQKAIMARPDSRPLLAGIAVPTLLICGRQDQGTPVETHEEMAAGIPGARLCVIEECGHLSTMERPQAVTVLMRDWLMRD